MGILPGGSYIADRDTHGVALKILGALLSHKLIPLIRVKDSRCYPHRKCILQRIKDQLAIVMFA